jgi:hypothetical protein
MTSLSTPAAAGASTVTIPPFVAPDREGELAARVVGEVQRQEYSPAIRAATFLSFMAAGRRMEWRAWRDTLQGFAGSMFQHPFIALGEAVGLEEANRRIGSFGAAFAPSFEAGLDRVAAGEMPGGTFTPRERERMADWLQLLEKVDSSLPVLDALYGPRRRPGPFSRPRLQLPGGQA